METQRFELYRVSEETVHLLPTQEAAKVSRFSDALALYSKLVLEEDRQRFLDAVRPDNIIRHTETEMIYSVPFRRVFEDGVRRYRVEFCKRTWAMGRSTSSPASRVPTHSGMRQRGA